MLIANESAANSKYCTCVNLSKYLMFSPLYRKNKRYLFDKYDV